MQTIDKFEGKYYFLSNFFLATIVYEGKEYASSEHLFQALKTLSEEEREWVRSASTPAEAKRRGKKVKKQKNWHNIRKGVMKDVLRLKFGQNPELATKLKATQNATLIEGNWWGDTDWGVCDGIGDNMLGKLLEEVREELKEN